MKKILILLAALIAVALVCLFTVKGVENRAISYEQSIEQAQSNVEAEEQRRFDLIPNLVECVKAYDKHEYETLTAVVEARRGGQISDVEDIKTMIAAVVERYPELQSQKNYKELMNELAITENQIVAVRKAYNKTVTNYQRFIRQFPAKQLLSVSGYEVKDYETFAADPQAKQAPKVKFD